MWKPGGGTRAHSLARNLSALMSPWAAPLLALTAYARMEDCTRGMVAGFNMHVARLIEPAALLIKIASLTGRLTRG